MANLQALAGFAQSAGNFALQHWKPIAATVGGYIAATNILPKVFQGKNNHAEMVAATNELDSLDLSSAGA